MLSFQKRDSGIDFTGAGIVMETFKFCAYFNVCRCCHYLLLKKYLRLRDRRRILQARLELLRCRPQLVCRRTSQYASSLRY